MIDFLIRTIADGLVVVIAGMGAIAYFSGVRRERWQQYLRAFMAGLSAFTVAKLFSLLYETSERPFVALGIDPKAAFIDNPGFPSDHALFVGAITLVVACATGNKRLFWIFAILSAVVGVGRVVALVHTPLDVIGGYVAAVLGVLPWYLYRIRSNLK